MEAVLRERAEEMMDALCKFNIGDYVIDAGTNHSFGGKQMIPVGDNTVAGMRHGRIIERWIQQCHGGIQKQYTVSLGYGKSVLCVETTLELAPPIASVTSSVSVDQ